MFSLVINAIMVLVVILLVSQVAILVLVAPICAIKQRNATMSVYIYQNNLLISNEKEQIYHICEYIYTINLRIPVCCAAPLMDHKYIGCLVPDAEFVQPYHSYT